MASNAHNRDGAGFSYVQLTKLAGSAALRTATRRAGKKSMPNTLSSTGRRPFERNRQSSVDLPDTWRGRLRRSLGAVGTRHSDLQPKTKAHDDAASGYSTAAATSDVVHQLPEGQISYYGDAHLRGEIAVLGSGEYMQAERGPSGVTLIWTTDASAADVVGAFVDLLGAPPAHARGFVTLDRPNKHRKTSARKVIRLAREWSGSVRVLSMDNGDLSVAWRASVRKLAEGTPKNECALTVRHGHVSSLSSLLERTGTDYVVKAANEVLPRLDLLGPVR